MWTQLKLVKEARGKLGILSHRCRLYRTVADESTDIIEHTTEMRRIQEELGMLGSVVTDEDFLMLLISSLPKSWINSHLRTSDPLEITQQSRRTSSSPSYLKRTVDESRNWVGAKPPCMGATTEGQAVGAVEGTPHRGRSPMMWSAGTAQARPHISTVLVQGWQSRRERPRQEARKEEA